ncbi:MAG: B12-binding domain-containing radical SAM protein [Eggerthellaceae bacterium]|jgi:radical SAM superfamily enzyme YgiQ (UPF0313 family)
MNVAFITPAPWLKRLPIYRAWSHLYGTRDAITGPLILAGIVKRAGHTVEAYEELRGDVDYDRLCAWADVVSIYTMTSLAPRAYDIADFIHRNGHARVIIGGMHASSVPEEALGHADQVMVGEGENTILDVVEGRRTEKIVYCDPVTDLDAVPWPDYSVLKTPVEAADIMTTRGCPFSCSFCTTSRSFSPYRERSVESVIAEIRHYKDLGFRYINFEDDNFTANKKRAKEICRRIIDENLQSKETFFFGRTDMANDPELLDLLAAANLNWVLIGIESINQAALDEIDKRQNYEDIRRAGIACQKHGIQLIASIVLGIDTDGPKDIARAAKFAKEIGATKLQPAILTPYPGTPVYDQFLEEGRMIFDDERGWEAFDMTSATFQPKKMSPWDLQMEFFRCAFDFYDLSGAITTTLRNGFSDGFSRFMLGVAARGGWLGEQIAANFVKDNIYYKIRHTPWKYATDNGLPEGSTSLYEDKPFCFGPTGVKEREIEESFAEPSDRTEEPCTSLRDRVLQSVRVTEKIAGDGVLKAKRAVEEGLAVVGEAVVGSTIVLAACAKGIENSLARV